MGESQGGDSKLETFLKANMQMISKRMPKCGIIAIFDWESNVNTNKLGRHFNVPNYIYKFDSNSCNPLLDKSFHGIERYYDIELIETLASNKKGLVTDRGNEYNNSRYFADSGRYERVKHELFKIFESKGMQFRHFDDLILFLSNVDNTQLTCLSSPPPKGPHVPSLP